MGGKGKEVDYVAIHNQLGRVSSTTVKEILTSKKVLQNQSCIYNMNIKIVKTGQKENRGSKK